MSLLERSDMVMSVVSVTVQVTSGGIVVNCLLGSESVVSLRAALVLDDMVSSSGGMEKTVIGVLAWSTEVGKQGKEE